MKKTEASGIMDIILIFAIGAGAFAIINGVTLMLTSNTLVSVPVFIISAFLCFWLWPMDRFMESDMKNLGKKGQKGEKT